MPCFISPLGWTASLDLILVYPPLMGFAPRLQIRTEGLSREMESVSTHTHFASFPNNHSREKASSIISSNGTDVRNKGKESRVRSNFNTRKQREYTFHFPVCLRLLLSTGHQQQVPGWQLPSLEGSESVLAQEAATDRSHCTLQGQRLRKKFNMKDNTANSAGPVSSASLIIAHS